MTDNIPERKPEEKPSRIAQALAVLIILAIPFWIGWHLGEKHQIKAQIAAAKEGQ